MAYCYNLMKLNIPHFVSLLTESMCNVKELLNMLLTYSYNVYRITLVISSREMNGETFLYRYIEQMLKIFLLMKSFFIQFIP